MTTPTPQGGVRRIAAERQRQIEEKGYDTEHDLNHHTAEELMDAAWCYFAQAEALMGSRPGFQDRTPYSWPFAREAFDPAPTSVRNLEKAGALIAAAIDLQIAAGFCPNREDATHCVHWWDNDGPCCSCGDDIDTPTEVDRMALPDEPEGASLGNILGYKDRKEKE